MSYYQNVIKWQQLTRTESTIANCYIECKIMQLKLKMGMPYNQIQIYQIKLRMYSMLMAAVFTLAKKWTQLSVCWCWEIFHWVKLKRKGRHRKTINIFSYWCMGVCKLFPHRSWTYSEVFQRLWSIGDKGWIRLGWIMRNKV